MKPFAPLLVSACLLTSSRLVSAADRYWDANLVLPGIGGAGNWNTSSALWAPNTTGTAPTFAWNNAASDNAFFFGTPAAVTTTAPISARSLSFLNDGSVISGSQPITLVNAGTPGSGPAQAASINVLAGAAATINTDLLGPSDIYKLGGGTLTLGATANPYIATFHISQGTLKPLATGALQNATLAVDIDNALDLSAVATLTLGNLSGAGTLSVGNASLTVGSANADATYGGTFYSNGTFTKLGAAKLTLSGGGAVHHYNLSAGTLVLASPPATPRGFATTSGAAVGSPTPLDSSPTLQIGANSFVVFSGDGSAISGAPTTSGGWGARVQVDAGGLWNDGYETDIGYANQSGQIQVAGAFNSTHYLVVGYSGQASFNLLPGATSTCQWGMIGLYPGSVGFATVNAASWSFAGGLNFGGFGSAFAGGAGTLTIAGGGSVSVALDTSFWNNNNLVLVDAATFSTGYFVEDTGVTGKFLLRDPDPATSALTVGSHNSNTSFAGSLGDFNGPGGLTKVGTASLTLSGSANTFTGPTRINGGTIRIASPNALQNSTVILNVDDGLEILTPSATLGNLAGAANLSFPGKELILGNAPGSATYSGFLSGAGATLTKIGLGDLTLTGGASLGALHYQYRNLYLAAPDALHPKTYAFSEALIGPDQPAAGAFAGHFYILAHATLDTSASIFSSVSGETSGGSTNAFVVINDQGTWLDGAETRIGLNGRKGAIEVYGQYSAQQTIVGDSGIGFFQCDDGGRAHSVSAIIARNLAASGYANIAAVGSAAAWDIDQNLDIGDPLTHTGGIAQLYVSHGGTLTVGGAIRCWVACDPLLQSAAILAGAIIDSPTAPFNLTLSSFAPGSGPADLTLGSAPTNSIIYGKIVGDGSITKIGASTLTLAGQNTFTGLTHVVQGALINTGTLACIIIAESGTTISGPGKFSTITLNPGSTLLLSSSQNIPYLTLGPTAAAAIAPNANATLAVSLLTLAGATNAWTATLDIANNALIVLPDPSSKSATLATLQNQITFGLTRGGGGGITSTTTTADPTHKTTIVIDNALLNLTQFGGGGGQSVDANSLLIASTWYGDSNLDRKVDVSDLGTLATHYGQPSTTGPLSGDFNNDGHIDVTDLGLLATNYGAGTMGGGVSPFSQLPITNYQLPTPNPVPEPASLLLLATLPLLSRRRPR